MIKFRITPSRFAEACNIIEYLAATNKHRDTIIRIAPRFILDENGEYIVKVNLDDDGDITSYEHVSDALLRMTAVTPKRLEKLVDEFGEAARAIVNPTSGGDSNKPTSTATEKPPPG